ncbi:MAG: hypothetical protein KIS92_15450, partial [Planctomycetota bacterium]|nr:hypothetical protein [Planctomycetota bacterium]
MDERCRAAGSGAAWADGHLTLSQLLQTLDVKLPREGARAPRVAEGAARSAAIARAWKAAGRSDEPTLDALDSVGRLIAAWKGAGAGPEAIESAAVLVRQAGHARVSDRLSLVARVYGAYEKELGEAWTDREGREAGLLRRLRAAAQGTVFPAGTRLVLSGFHRIVPLHRAVLECLRAQGCAVSVEPAIPWPDEEAGGAVGAREPEPFETVARSFGRLRDAALPARFAHAHEIRRAEAPTQYSEVYEIGRRVRRWIEDERVAPERICVA